MTKVIEYSSNNSGGEWWLTDKDWVALEKAGWKVEWGGKYFCGEALWKIPEGAPTPHISDGDCKGHLKYKSIEEVDANNDRFLGAAARSATREGLDMDDAIHEFKSVTGQDASDEGCLCCGSPHYFSETDKEES